MNRNEAAEYAREQLNKYNLDDWSIRLTTSERAPLGLCSYKDKCIILSAHHIDIHPDYEIQDTILHEIAHALSPIDFNHGEQWKAKAIEIGASPEACSNFSLSPDLIDAIRSGATIEYTIEETIVKTPKVRITRLQDKCPICGVVAEHRFETKAIDKNGDEVLLITLKCFHIIKKVIPKATPFNDMVSNGWRDDVKSCQHEWIKNQCNKCKEYKLFNFQIASARFVEQGLAIQKGAGIFHDMGLGKTIIPLAYIKYHPSETNPTLYVVKSAIKFNWLKEILRWLGPSYLGQIINTSKDSLIPGLKTYIIAYDLLRRFPKEKLEALNIKLIVMDECQQIKNVDSGRTQALRKIVNNPSIKVIPLSGTPWKNRGSEFFPVLNILSPTKFHSQAAYVNNWVAFEIDHNGKRKERGINRPEKFKEYIKDIVIRYEYNEVMDEYPDINRMKIPVQLDELTQREYDNSTSAFIAWYNTAIIDGTEDQLSGIEILAKLAKMRHITGLAKIPATISFAEDFYENTDKSLVIFVHHQDVGSILYDEFKKLFTDVNVCKITGAMNDVEKFESAEKFNTKRSFMIASTLAAGEGINLQSCHDSIMHERQWNPQNEDQAAPGRFRRIGQKSNVINISFCEAEDTVDEYLDILVDKKRKAFHDAMNNSELKVWSENNIGLELAKMIMTKHRASKSKLIDKNENKPSITAMASM